MSGIVGGTIQTGVTAKRDRDERARQFNIQMDIERKKLPFEQLEGAATLQEIEEKQRKLEGWGRVRNLFAQSAGRSVPEQKPSQSQGLVDAIVSQIKSGGI
jgi:hypothetical protein